MTTVNERRCGTTSDLARRIGVSVATASRLASGDRSPSVVLMRRIEIVTGWPMATQCEAYMAGTYGQRLRDRLTQWHPTEQELAEPPIRVQRKRVRAQA